MSIKVPIISAGLYLVATPIGTASDLSFRAVKILEEADILLAEDTRQLRKLMTIFGIKLNKRLLLSVNDFNEEKQTPKVVAKIKDGKSVALVSDAGTPMVADPGYRLVSAIISAGFNVTGVPGASAFLLALIVSGLPTDKFLFVGFPPAKSSARKTFVEKFSKLEFTTILYEAPSRVVKTIISISEVCGSDRKVVICRELTKKFEEVIRGTVEEILNSFQFSKSLKGEFVLLIGPSKSRSVGDEEIDLELQKAFNEMSFKDSIEFVSRKLETSRKLVYARGLKVKNL